MCSSPAYPTSAPLGGPIAGNRTASAQSEDVIDISSKGLLPQLIDVLHALTEGQELLSRKVRDARLEHACHSSTVVDRRPQAEPADDPSSRLSRSPDGSFGVHGGPPMDNVELGAESTSIDCFANASLPEPSGRASENATDRKVASPSDTPEAIETHSGMPADTSSEPSARTDWLNSAQPGEMTTASLNRDYNFFDELDARLADLEDPADRSEG